MGDTELYRITKEVHFEAAHLLTGMPEGHKCGKLHGHSYRVIFALEGSVLDENGLLFDYGILSALVKPLDHELLNEKMGGLNPTAENLAFFLYETLSKVLFKMDIVEAVRVKSVKVHETESSSAEYLP